MATSRRVPLAFCTARKVCVATCSSPAPVFPSRLVNFPRLRLVMFLRGPGTTRTLTGQEVCTSRRVWLALALEQISPWHGCVFSVPSHRLVSQSNSSLVCVFLLCPSLQATLMSFGQDGYLAITKTMMDTANIMKAGVEVRVNDISIPPTLLFDTCPFLALLIPRSLVPVARLIEFFCFCGVALMTQKSIPGIRLVAKSNMTGFAMTSDHPSVNILAVADAMETKGFGGNLVSCGALFSLPLPTLYLFAV